MWTADSKCVDDASQVPFSEKDKAVMGAAEVGGKVWARDVVFRS